MAELDTDTEDKIPFTAHLEELRKRLITCFIAVGVGFIAGVPVVIVVIGTPIDEFMNPSMTLFDSVISDNVVNAGGADGGGIYLRRQRGRSVP